MLNIKQKEWLLGFYTITKLCQIFHISCVDKLVLLTPEYLLKWGIFIENFLILTKDVLIF